MTLNERIDAWASTHMAALAALSEAEAAHAHSNYALAQARAQAEQHIREQAFTETKKLTESAIEAQVALDPEVQVHEQAAMATGVALDAAKNTVEAQRVMKSALSWHVALETRPLVA